MDLNNINNNYSCFCWWKFAELKQLERIDNGNICYKCSMSAHAQQDENRERREEFPEFQVVA